MSEVSINDSVDALYRYLGADPEGDPIYFLEALRDGAALHPEQVMALESRVANAAHSMMQRADARAASFQNQRDRREAVIRVVQEQLNNRSHLGNTAAVERIERVLNSLSDDSFYIPTPYVDPACFINLPDVRWTLWYGHVRVRAGTLEEVRSAFAWHHASGPAHAYKLVPGEDTSPDEVSGMTRKEMKAWLVEHCPAYPRMREVKPPKTTRREAVPGLERFDAAMKTVEKPAEKQEPTTKTEEASDNQALKELHGLVNTLLETQRNLFGCIGEAAIAVREAAEAHRKAEEAREVYYTSLAGEEVVPTKQEAPPAPQKEGGAKTVNDWLHLQANPLLQHLTSLHGGGKTTSRLACISFLRQEVAGGHVALDDLERDAAAWWHASK